MVRASAYLGILCFLFGTSLIPSSSGDNSTAQNSTLYFGVFISRESDFDFSGFIPPLELGVQTINNNETVLKGLNEMNYYIQYELTNAKVSIVRSNRAHALLLPATDAYVSLHVCSYPFVTYNEISFLLNYNSLAFGNQIRIQVASI